MLKIINRNEVQAVTLDSLYTHAKAMNFRVVIDDNYWLSDCVRVELKCKNRNGSSFEFVGKSTSSLNEAFLNAFKEAEIVGKGYGS